jgi:beta-lactamase class D
VKIALLKAGTEVGTIKDSTSTGNLGTGAYTWPMATTGTTGSDFKVSVQSISLPTIKDTSNNTFNITPASLPSITVTTPNGGETWQRGTTQTITWSYTGSPGSTVKIVLLKAGTEVGTIKDSTSTGSIGTGSYSWPMATTGTTGSDFKVSVQSISQPTIKDTSNNTFNITPPLTPTITITSPNGGETWQRGTTQTITWSYTGSPGSTVKIALLKGGIEVGTIKDSMSTGNLGTGAYTWPMATTGTTGSDFKVSVQSISLPTIKDTSNNTFNITPAPTPTITVTSPNGGETWQRGTTKTITWSYTGSPGSTVKIVLLKAGTEVGTIKDSTSTGNLGTGAYTWPMASSGTTGNDFMVSVQSINQPTVKDASNNNFTITL